MADYQRPETTMGESEKKGNIRFRVAINVATLLIFGMTYFGWFNTFLAMWYQNGGGFVHFLGIVMFIASVLWVWLSDKYIPAFMGKIPPMGASLVLAFLIPVVASAFNFSL